MSDDPGTPAPRKRVAHDEDDLTIERPRAAATELGISLPTFWRRVRDDPDFPKLVRLGRQSVGIVRGERLAYVRKLIAKRDGRAA